MASITNIADVFKYMANNFASLSKQHNVVSSGQQAVNTADAAPANVSKADSGANVNFNADKNKNAAPAAVKSDLVAISSAAQNASSLHSQIQSTGSQNAAIFRTALTNLVSNISSNSASGALGSFLGFGAAMAETGNLKTYTDMSLMVTGLNKLTTAGSAVTSKFINQAQASLKSFGAETAGSFINAARKVMDAATFDRANNGSQSGALNNLNKLWETTSNLKGISVEQKSGMLAGIAADVKSKGSLSEINDYLKQRLEAMDEDTEEEPALSSGANFNELTVSAQRSKVFAGALPLEEYQSSLYSASLKNGANPTDAVKNINAYKNNMNLSAASTLLNIGV